MQITFSLWENIKYYSSMSTTGGMGCHDVSSKGLGKPCPMALSFVVHMVSQAGCICCLRLSLAVILFSWHLQHHGFPLWLRLHTHRFPYTSPS
jgi:hypothetical protein